MVPRADLPAAVTLNSMGFNITRSVGPAIGGIIVAAAGAAAAFAVNALSYFALIYALLRWKPATSHLDAAAGNPWQPPSPQACVMSRCRPTSKRCCCAGSCSAWRRSAILALLPVVARRPRQGGAADLRPHARRLRCRRHWRGAARRAAARDALQRDDRALGLYSALRSVRRASQPSAQVPCSPAPALADSAAPAGCWRFRCSTRSCSFRRRAGWSGGRLSLYQTVTFGGIAGWKLGLGT